MATIVTQVFSPTSYNPSDEVLLNPSITQSVFDPSQNYIEYTIQTLDESFTTTDYSYNRYSFPKSGVTSNDIGDIIISYNFMNKPKSQNIKNFKKKVKEKNRLMKSKIFTFNKNGNVRKIWRKI